MRLFLAGLGVMGLVWQHVQATRLGYEVEKARRRLRQLEAQVASSQMALERDLAPAQVAQKARRLGMSPVSPDRVRLLAESEPAGTFSRPMLGMGLAAAGAWPRSLLARAFSSLPVP